MAKKLSTTTIDKTVSARLKALYDEAKEAEGFTGIEFAKDIGISKSALSQALKGDMAISEGLALRLARRLRCHPVEFHPSFIGYDEDHSFRLNELFVKLQSLPKEERDLIEASILNYYRRFSER